MNSPRLAELQEGDAEGVFQILTEVYRLGRHPMGGVWSLSNLYRELDRGRGLGFFQGRDLLSFVIYQPVPGAWEISVLATHPAHQGQGLMRRLMGELIRQKPSDRAIWLEVHEANDAARNLYQQLGFRQSGQRPGYYRDGRAAILLTYS